MSDRRLQKSRVLSMTVAGIVAALSLGALAVPALADTTSMFEPASTSATQIRDFYLLILAITGVIFVVVEGILFYSIFRYRCRGETVDSEPPQIYGSGPVEVAWTVLPILIVVVLFMVTLRYIFLIRWDDKPEGAMVVDVIGRQWWWEYQYPEFGFKTANEMHIPMGEPEANKPVYLQLQSVDVIHSFWVPRLSGKTDVIPNRTNHMWFESDKPGLYLGQCAEFCGEQHANMLLRVYVDTPAEFQKWVENQQKPAVEDPKVKAGRDLFLSFACINCHTVRGTIAKGTAGPDLTHLASRETIASGMVENNHENLTQWVTDPQKIKPGALMPDMQLTPEQVKLVVEYLESLK